MDDACVANCFCDCVFLFCIEMANLRKILRKGAISQHIFQMLHYFKTGAKRRTIYPIFGYSNDTTFNRHINSTIDIIAEKFVPKYLGPTAWDIKNIENKHTPQFSKEIFANAVGVIDGGYYHIQKLSHHELQKKTWSTHKNYNLIKFLDVSFMDGRVYDCFGPYFTDTEHNDQTIWDSIVENNENNINDVFDPSFVFFT